MSKESLISVKKIRDILNEVIKGADWECTGGLYALGKEIEPHLVKIESDLNELIMADMTHEYNEAEAERHKPEFARQALAHALKEDYSIFFDAIKALPEEDMAAVDNYFSEYYIKEIDRIERVFPDDFHPNTTLAGKVMNLWQYYEAEVNKNKYLNERLSESPMKSEGATQDTIDLEEIYAVCSTEFGLMEFPWTEGERGQKRLLHFLRSQLKKYLSEGAEERGWVRVEDGLPEMEQRVLVIGNDVGVSTARLINKEKRIFDSHDWICSSDDVTHWMPLPPAPLTEK